MQATAEKIGVDFSVKDEYGQLNLLRDFELFKKGYGKQITNMLSYPKADDGPDFRVFDYKYVIGAGNNTRAIKQTVFFVHSKALNLPQLFMKPENFFDRVGKYFGMQDINFETHPVFSKEYLLQGPDEDLIRKQFNEEVLRYFTIEKKWRLEGINYMMIFYARGKRIPPEQIDWFHKKGMEVYNLFTEDLE